MKRNIVTVETTDQPGQLGKIAQLLADAGVNIEAFNCFGGNLQIVPDNPDKAVEALKKNKIDSTKMEVLAVDLANTRGTLARLANDLGKAGVNIEASFGDAQTRNSGRVYLAVDNIQKATPIVEKAAAMTAPPSR